MTVSLQVLWFVTDAGRSQPVEFVDALADRKMAAQIVADITAYAAGTSATDSKAINGYAPMFELRTGGYRILAARDGDTIWILHVCKKQDQKRGIRAAAKRMKLILGA